MSEPAALYRDRRELVARELASLERRFARVAAARLGVFLAAVGFAVWTVVARGGTPLLVLGFLALGFIALVAVHERVARARARARASLGYYERGLARLEGRWIDGGDDGDRFRDDTHLYSSDLEL